jgi:hypothetical protein
MAKRKQAERAIGVPTVTGKGVTCRGCGEKNMMRYKIVPGAGDFCYNCAPRAKRDPKSTFPFVTTNISGKSIEVQSLRHLRQLEAQHGVQSFAYNQDHPETRESARD